MLKAKRGAVLPVLAVVAFLLMNSGCRLVEQSASFSIQPASAQPTVTPLVTPTLVPQLQTPSGQPLPGPGSDDPTVDNGVADAWQLLQPGLERRHMSLLTSEGSVQEKLYVLRLDPSYFYFDVGYKPGLPQRLSDWQQDTGALIVVNGGFFTADNIATGLVIVDGQAYGTSYEGFGGMLVIKDGVPAIRSLSQQPYDPYEYLQAGLQSFPLLVVPGGQLGFPDEDGLADRRTVMAEDSQGRILFILAVTGSLTLHEMSRFLLASDLEITVALNLDGGASTGIQVSEPSEGVAPYSLLPTVITIHPSG